MREGSARGKRGDEEQWLFPSVVLTKEEKRGILAEVMKIVSELMFETHPYTLNGNVYKHRKGGPIGLRRRLAL